MLKKIFQLPKIKQSQADFDINQHKDAYLSIIIVDTLDEKQVNKIKSLKPIHTRFSLRPSKTKKSFITQFPNDQGTYVLLIEKDAPFEFMSELKDALTTIKPLHGEVILVNQSCDQISEANALRTLLAFDVEMPNYKKIQNVNTIQTITVYSTHQDCDFTPIIAGHKGNALARVLAATPTNYLKPSDYKKIIEALAKQYQWQLKFYHYDELEKMGAGSFCAVARACPDHAYIARLSYHPKKASKTVTLVGKGICFDTGGVSLKQPQYMYNMHEDMQGSAVALGSLVALTESKANVNVECFLAVTQNLIGENAYLLNEVVTALNGTTIEVTDTDAEGRMVLADTLHLASETKPDLLIDYATLTGAAVRALSTRYMALFSKEIDKIPQFIQAGLQSGERAWPLPLSDDFDELIKSDVADVLQCTVAPSADHILAARFLNRFVNSEKVKSWVHLDLAASMNKGGLGSIPSDYTGIGVFYTLALLKSLVF